MAMFSWRLLFGAAAALSLATSANAQFTVRTVDGTPGPNPGDPNVPVNSITDGETILATNATAGTGSFATVNFFDNGDEGIINGSVNVPGGLSNTDDYALEAFGIANVIAGTSGSFEIGVNSDDGFRVRVNNVVVQEFAGARDDPDFATQLTTITLNDGDNVRLTFFERNGGDSVEFFVRTVNNADLGVFDGADVIALVGDPASGVLIDPIPEPATAGLLATALVAGLSRRRRRATSNA